jgi:DNA-binding MarR family transcriptional regulator
VVRQELARRYETLGVRPAEAGALMLLRRNAGLPAVRLAAALGMKQTNLVSVLDRLQQRGLLERRQLAGDRRAVALHATAAGVALAERLEAEVALHEAQLVHWLGREGRYQLAGLLHRLTEAAASAQK